MKIVFSFLALAFLFTSCDDGDIITTELDFGDTFTTCGDLVCYKIRTSPDETLSIIVDTTIEALITTIVDPDNALLVILENDLQDEVNSAFNYRTYSNAVGNNVFCSSIPPSNLGLVNDYPSSCTARFETILIEDDNDGILAELEDLNGDGNLDNDDTDGDGLPNYLDDDDDGDNVKTKIEIESAIITTTTELLTVRDTDGDGIKNYLDTNDDGDAVDTIDEEGTTQNQNPADDFDDVTINIAPDYLNNAIANTIPATAFAAHTINQEFVIELTAIGIILPILIQDEVAFGTLTESGSRTVTPTF